MENALPAYRNGQQFKVFAPANPLYITVDHDERRRRIPHAGAQCLRDESTRSELKS
jgi:hypothetical protein